MIIFLSGILSRFFSNLEISMVLTIFLYRIDGLLLKYDMIIFLSGFFSNLDFNGFDHISSQDQWFTYQISYDNFLIWIFIRFPDFFWFSSNLNFFVWNKSLLCSRSRILVFKSCYLCSEKFVQMSNSIGISTIKTGSVLMVIFQDLSKFEVPQNYENFLGSKNFL